MMHGERMIHGEDLLLFELSKLRWEWGCIRDFCMTFGFLASLDM